MSRRPFAPHFADLPRSLPIFPLSGVLLLPDGRLPLNVFEPRYLAMVDDALAAERLVGMVQPLDPGSRERDPPVYPIGCAGRITSFSETEDGRYLITLAGVCRFRIIEEVPTLRGYRRVMADWDRFQRDMTSPTPEPGDPAIDQVVDRQRLTRGLQRYFSLQGITADWDTIAATPDDRLINTLAMICPFEPPEKQALLEAYDLEERGRQIITLIEMAVAGTGDDGRGARH